MAVLEIDALTKRYGRVLAVDDVSFRVERGQVFGLLGQNGSGKTTTLSCALGLLRPTGGRTAVLGEPWRTVHRTQGRVGVVFDAPILTKGLTIRGQLRYARRLFGHDGGRSLDEALDLVGMGPLAGRRVTRLSLGQQKRLAVAAALMGTPELLILDEPLSGLDPLGARDLLRLFGELAADGVTIVVSSHRLNDIEPVLTHAAVVLNGRLAASGSMEELLGARRGLTLRVGDPESAVRLLGERFETATPSKGAGDRIELQGAAASDAPLVARTLVDSGIDVHELAPREQSLASLFEELAEAARADHGGPG